MWKLLLGFTLFAAVAQVAVAHPESETSTLEHHVKDVAGIRLNEKCKEALAKVEAKRRELATLYPTTFNTVLNAPKEMKECLPKNGLWYCVLDISVGHVVFPFIILVGTTFMMLGSIFFDVTNIVKNCFLGNTALQLF